MKLERAVVCLHFICILQVASLASRTHAFCLAGQRSARLSGTARSTTTKNHHHCVGVFRRPQPLYLSAGDDNRPKDSSRSSETSNPQIDKALSNELSEMFPQGLQEEEESMTLYNAVPLFTGTIFFVVSIAATAYLYYAGLTGDDPFTGHPN